MRGVTPDDVLFNLELQGPKQVHFVGVGGIAMAYLARWFLTQSWKVTGSDIATSPLTQELRREGVKFFLGHRKANVPPGAGLVIRSQAIQPANAEIRIAIRRKIALFTLPQIVGALTRRYDTVSVAGAHGKSTSTSLLALVLMAAKRDPTVLVGTKLKELGGKNFRKGSGKWLVLETDEYGRAFLQYSPLHLLVTNIDREHLDTYKDLSDIKRTFLKLFSNVMPNGTLVLNADNENLRSLKGEIRTLARARKVKVHWYSAKDPIGPKLRKVLQIPGAHNLSNAIGVYTLARQSLGVPAAVILKAVGRYKGSWRRYEHKGSFKAAGVKYDVFDDYAHHPTEIKVNLETFREKFPKSTLICVFQPHQAERLRKLFPEFQGAFKPADILVLFPEYRVAGRDKARSQFTAETLAAAVARREPDRLVAYLRDTKKFSRKYLQQLSATMDPRRKHAVVVMMGAGNIADFTPKLLK